MTDDQCKHMMNPAWCGICNQTTRGDENSVLDRIEAAAKRLKQRKMEGRAMKKRPNTIASGICTHHGISIEDLTSKKKTRPIAAARAAIVKELSGEKYELKQKEIAFYAGITAVSVRNIQLRLGIREPEPKKASPKREKAPADPVPEKEVKKTTVCQVTEEPPPAQPARAFWNLPPKDHDPPLEVVPRHPVTEQFNNLFLNMMS